MTAKASNHKDTYRAVAVFLALMGILYLADRLIGFCLARLAVGDAERHDAALCGGDFPMVQVGQVGRTRFGRHLADTEYRAGGFLAGADVGLSASGGIAPDRHPALLAFLTVNEE